jgi:hypothetical protein
MPWHLPHTSTSCRRPDSGKHESCPIPARFQKNTTVAINLVIALADGWCGMRATATSARLHEDMTVAGLAGSAWRIALRHSDELAMTGLYGTRAVEEDGLSSQAATSVTGSGSTKVSASTTQGWAAGRICRGCFIAGWFSHQASLSVSGAPKGFRCHHWHCWTNDPCPA